MSDYISRQANISDVEFLAEAVIEAEKSGTEKNGFSALFNLSETKIKELLIKMFEEEIDGCELSISSYLVSEFNGKPVAAIGGWIERFNDDIPSLTLKSNLIAYLFPKESIKFAQSNSEIMGDIRIERHPMSLQIGVVYVQSEHRGQKLGQILMQEHFKRALLNSPQLEKAQIQIFSNNISSIKLYEKIGFKLVKMFKTKKAGVINFLPSSEKLLMEINFK